MMKCVVVASALMVGCMGELPWEDGDTGDDGSGPFAGSGAYTIDSVPMPTATARGIDGDVAPAFGIAVGGHETLFLDAQGASGLHASVTGPFAVARYTSGWAELVATAAGTGELDLDGSYPAGHGVGTLPLVATPVAAVYASVPGYRALAPWPAPPPTTFLGPTVYGDVHLVGADGRDLLDTAMTLTGPGVSGATWDTFSLTGNGAASITVAGPAVGSITLPLTLVDHLDRIELVDNGDDPPATSYHTVCAHGFAGPAEVATSWTLYATGAEAQAVTTAPRAGNCLDVLPGAEGATVTATASDGETATLAI